MNTLVKSSLAIGGGLVALEGLRRMFRVQPKPRYEPWERKPYREFENKVLILGVASGVTTRPRRSAARSRIATTWGSC